VPGLEQVEVTAIEAVADGFTLQLDNGEKEHAHRVVIAIGVGPFRYIPESLSGLHNPLLSHSFDHHDLSQFAGSSIAVIGGGSSAIDLAGLLRERGCDVTLVTRRASLRFSGRAGPPSSRRPSLWRRIRHPSSGLGPGLRSRFSTDAPLLIHALPKRLRLEFVRRHLGPAAAQVMKNKVIGRVPLLLERELVAAVAECGRVALTLRRKDGEEDVLRVDRVIAATGFRIDPSRLSFLSPSLRDGIAKFRSTPILTRDFESSVRGLYFIGPAAAASFGPVMRFTFGARFSARRLSGALVKAQRRNELSAFSAVGASAGEGV
jgi:Pyridine nucleotide-disulphide oxidoreductase